jgi:hypothetical protein
MSRKQWAFSNAYEGNEINNLFRVFVDIYYFVLNIDQ